MLFRSELRVFNQFTEVFSVNDIARRVADAGPVLGLDVEIESIPNPRQERERHHYNPAHSGLLELGLQPHPMTRDVLVRMLERLQRYRHRIDPSHVMPRVRWNPKSGQPG